MVFIKLGLGKSIINNKKSNGFEIKLRGPSNNFLYR